MELLQRKNLLLQDLQCFREPNRRTQNWKTYAPGASPWETFFHLKCALILGCLRCPSENEAVAADKLV